jgi:tetratricopeptide (TPR) repeat protein
VRICISCETPNAVLAETCDKCKLSITDLVAVAKAKKIKLSGSAEAEIPSTEIRRLSNRPQEKPAPPAPLDDLWKGDMPAPVVYKPREDDVPSKWRNPMVDRAAAAWGVFLAVWGIWHWQTHKPENWVPKLGARYLEALRLGDYGAAYGLFSKAAKNSCSEAEFRASRDATTWTWSNLRLEHQEPEAILLAYDLEAAGSPPRVDHVLFTLEDGRWTRPYNWTLMRQVEDAFEKGDADRGLILAQQAATINPRDPMAWGYLCEAAYYRKSPVDAETRCLKALELSRVYPSNLTLKSLYHLHAILADMYHHALKRPERSLEEYAQMLSFPDISSADQCQILLARAQAYAEISRPGESLADLQRGSSLCESEQDKNFIDKLRGSLRAP